MSFQVLPWAHARVEFGYRSHFHEHHDGSTLAVPASVTRVRATVSSFCGWARRHGLASANPITDSKVPSGEAISKKAEVYPFTIGQLREVVTELAARSERQASLTLVLGLTGLR